MSPLAVTLKPKTNACKYGGANSAIEIRVSRIGPQRAVIEVMDDGEGIPAEFEDKLFTAFSRSDTSDTRNSGGTGLGLKISKEMMDAMGGKIGYRRSDDDKSVFSLEFACLPEPIVDPNELAAPVSKRAKSISKNTAK